ncbi:MAG TPA: glycosyltransferase family 2 protein [Actinoplanes sp.]|nr:glycosyltransferase family 2 protein [Actinoplanes sp.]
MSVSVVVPCYRSAATLPALTTRLNAALAGHVPDFEVLLVIDGEDRATWQAAADLQRRHSRVRAMRLSRNFGQHNALVAGVRAARHDVVVTMDDDLQHPPEEVPKLLAALTDEVDLVYGVPAEEEHGVARSLASRLAKAGLERSLRIPGARQISAFRAFRTFLRDGFVQLNGPHACLDVALSWGTTGVAAVTVRMDERRHGRSNYTVRMLVRHTLNMVLGYSSAPLRLVTYLGFLVGVVGLALSARVLHLYFTGQTTVAGWTTVVCVVAVFSAAQMIALGVLGEYVGRVHANGLGLPTYVVRPHPPVRTAPAGEPVMVAPRVAEGAER